MKQVYEVRSTDYYGRFHQLCPDGVDKPTNKAIWSLPAKGERASILWPDGTRTVEMLYPVDGWDEEQIDMNNHPDTFSTRDFKIRRKYEGLAFSITLPAGTKVRKVK